MKSDWDLRAEKDMMERRFQMWVWVFISLWSFGCSIFFLVGWVKEGAARDLIGFFILLVILMVVSVAVWGNRR